MEPVKCVVYSRVSTDDQNYERQTAELVRYAEYKNYEIVKTFEEKISGATATGTRKEFNNLLNFINENPAVSCVLVWELSRIGRNMTDVLVTIDGLTAKGVNIFAFKESMNTIQDGKPNPLTKIIMGILSGFSELELLTTKQRVASGLRQSKQHGGANGAIQPYGYRSVKKKLCIDESEAETVKTIFNLYLQGNGTQKIAKYLNLQGIPSKKGVNWSDQQVYGILKNTVYIGKRLHKGETFDIEGIQIIQVEVFDKANQMLKGKYNKQDINRKYENPLKGVLVCGCCGLPYFMHKRKNNKDNAYKCISKRYRLTKDINKPVCNNTSIGIDKLQGSLIKHLSSEAVNIQEINTKLLELLNNRLVEVNNLIELHAKQADKVTQQTKELIKMRLNNEINEPDYNREYADLTTQSTKIERDTNRLSIEKYDIERGIQNIDSNKQAVTIDNLKQVIAKYVEKIVISGTPEKFYLNSKFKPYDVPVLVNVYFKAGKFLQYCISRYSTANYLIQVAKGHPETLTASIDSNPHQQKYNKLTNS